MVPTVLVIFVAVTSIAVVIQMGILIALYVSFRKTAAQMESIALDVQRRATPVLDVAREILDVAREILTDAAPKIKEVAGNLAETSAVVREQAQQLNVTMAEVVERARLQIIRADEMLTRTIDTAGKVQHTVLSPVRRISSIAQALSAGLGAFLHRRPSHSGERGSSNDGMFV